MTWRAEVAVTEVHRSPAWDAAQPVATVVVATCDRGTWLPGLLESLAQQAIPLEVVLVDDRSSTPVDVTADLPLLVLRTGARSGPSGARNAGAARARTPYLLLTDDDCLPQPGWAAALVAALEQAAVVQGRTSPAGDPHGPWDRSITVHALTGLYETCNLGLRADAFREAGGFADLHLLPGPRARGFGEDAELGSRVAATGGVAFARDAEVRHRWVPGRYRDHLRGQARLQGFPALAELVPEVDERLTAGVLLSRRTAVTDLGLAAVAASALTGWAALAAVPWVARCYRDAEARPGRPRAVRAAQLAVADAVGAAALVRGSVRARKPVL